MALELAQAKAHVIVNYLSNEVAAKETAQQVEALGGRATTIQADVGSAEDIERLLNSLESDGLAIDILVNNAGSILRPAAWNEQSDDDLVATINMHLIGPMRLIRALAPGMASRGYGRIINISTTYAIHGAAPVLAYTAAKAGLMTITYAMASELGQNNVTVNAIAPGNFATAMTDGAGEQVKEWSISTTPLGRLGDPAEIGHALRFLLESTFITGHVLVVDGGQLLNI